MQCVVHCSERCVIDCAYVDAEFHPVQNEIARIWMHVGPADGAAAMRRVIERDAIERMDRTCSHEQRVAA